MVEDRQKIVLTVARANDPDRYVSALFAPSKFVFPLLTLVAFNAELSRIAPSVSDPLLGDIRLQWWRDVLEHSDEQVSTGHPVADSLKSVARDYDLSSHDLLAMIDARIFDVSGSVMPDSFALKQYVDKIDGALFRLSLQVLGIERGVHNDLAQQAGYVYGVSRLLADLPKLFASGQSYFPQDELSAAGLEGQRGPSIDTVSNWGSYITGVAGEVEAKRGALIQDLRKLASPERAVFLPLVLVKPRLRGIERRAENLGQLVELNPLSRFWHLWCARQFGAF